MKFILVIAVIWGALNLANAQPTNLTPEIKIALIGDTEAGTGFGSVLKLIANERADAVMINGDFGYGSSPTAWKNRLISNIDIDKILVLGTLGNHDLGSDRYKYISIFNSFRTDRNGLKKNCTGSTNVSQGRDITAVDEVCTLGNVSIIGSAIGQVLSESYLEKQLENKLKFTPNENWKLVGYHFTLSNMNVVGKGNENSFTFFDLIRRYGAIGAQAHTHSAMASCPIVSEFKRGKPVVCHPGFTNPEERFIVPGVGIYIDSSIGGKEARDRVQCKNPTNAGCKHMVDLITEEGYTRTDGLVKTEFNRLGALFFIFNVNGNPKKAYAYYKSIDGQTIFKFNLVR